MLEQNDLTALDIVEKRKFFMRHFKVTGNRGDSRKHLSYSVVCKDLQTAVKLTEQAFPGCTIFTVADQGIIDKVDA